ncbi:MAG: 50S ribosomal protein L13 [Candidatus Pacebacteria bacterium]|nr:50S ribosomal protein L13 [Candidatus Paceibacterota bacterium]MBP9839432.1 50S ribosomal protein L13 [Candidatus Paceibacterota bacterium]MDQ5922556.1 large subunit ribosomal protein [Patescibacteria group bacterium]
MKEKNKAKEEKVIDASGMSLGRVASSIAMSLMGKTKPTFERNVYSGMPVKVVNASKLKITAKKLDEIFHTRYSGYPGGLRVIKGTETKEKRGLKELIKLAVYRMLPSNKLRKEMMKNLKVED